jgi:transcription elongation GreA/GreB family factor
VARTVYALEIRRRNLQIKRQVALAKLGRIENELKQIEERLRRLSASSAEAPPSPPPDAPSDDDDEEAAPFLLNY